MFDSQSVFLYEKAFETLSSKRENDYLNVWGSIFQWSQTYTCVPYIHACIIESEKIRVLNQLQIEVNEICLVKPQSSLNTCEHTFQSVVPNTKCPYVFGQWVVGISLTHLAGCYVGWS